MSRPSRRPSIRLLSGLSANLTGLRKGWALYGQVAVPMRVPDAGRLPRNIFHPVQIGCELACSHSLSEDIQLPVCPSCAQNRWQHLNGTAYFLFAHSRPTCVSPSIRTMSE